jgi:uncharacterized protein YdaU (DUF1376 family)
MAELPILPLATDAFLADTSHMSPETLGAYTRIMLVMWRHGGRLVDDDRELARIAGATMGRWRQIGPVIRRCLTSAGGQVSQKRLTATLMNVRDRRRVAAQNGERGAAARWGERDAEENKSGPRFEFEKRDSRNQKSISTCPLTPCDSSEQPWQTPFSGDGKTMGIQNQIVRESVETQSAPSRRAEGAAAPAGRPYSAKKPPAGSLATARGERALASPPGHEQAAAEGRKSPHLATRAELEAAFAGRREGGRG